MNLEDFSAGLAEVIGKPSRLRPFVCDGSPLKCRVFIVGHNPATESDRDFWEDWGPDGFDKKSWMAAYIEERASRPLKHGKSYRPRISPTRRVIDQVVVAAGMPILETNIYARTSPDMRSLVERDMAPFHYLVNTIKPDLLITHGKDAKEAADRLVLPSEIISVPHFSRGWSETKAIDLGKALRERF